MRKPRDFDAELKVLDQRAKILKTRQRDQLGDLVIATGAHALPIEVVAGALLAATTADATTREAWRLRGLAFFRGARESSAGGARQRRGAAPIANAAQSADGSTSAP